MDVQVIVQIGLYEVVHEGPDGRAPVYFRGSVFVLDRIAFLIQDFCLVGVGGTELGLGLAFEIRLLDSYAYCSDDSLPYVLGCIVLLEEFLERLGYGFPECRKVGASVAGVLAVHE